METRLRTPVAKKYISVKKPNLREEMETSIGFCLLDIWLSVKKPNLREEMETGCRCEFDCVF